MKRRSLSRDETALWKRATRGVKRLEAGPPVPGPPGLKTGETTREAMFPTKSQFRNSPSSFVTPCPLHPEEGPGLDPGRVTKDALRQARDEGDRALRMKANFEIGSGAGGSRPPSAFAAGDPALDRRARRGRLAPERAIDLHGMTQIAARVALSAFLERAHKDQCRCVLVVTGKGARALERAQGGRAPSGKAGLGDYAAPGSSGERSSRGIIRRRFAEWLDEAPLRGLVARAAPAAPKDGGAGAFYVFLKRKKTRL